MSLESASLAGVGPSFQMLSFNRLVTHEATGRAEGRWASQVDPSLLPCQLRSVMWPLETVHVGVSQGQVL